MQTVLNRWAKLKHHFLVANVIILTVKFPLFKKFHVFLYISLKHHCASVNTFWIIIFFSDFWINLHFYRYFFLPFTWFFISIIRWCRCNHRERWQMFNLWNTEIPEPWSYCIVKDSQTVTCLSIGRFYSWKDHWK